MLPGGTGRTGYGPGGYGPGVGYGPGGGYGAGPGAGYGTGSEANFNFVQDQFCQTQTKLNPNFPEFQNQMISVVYRLWSWIKTC